MSMGMTGTEFYDSPGKTSMRITNYDPNDAEEEFKESELRAKKR